MTNGSRKSIKLLGGAQMPVLGLGTYPLESAELEKVVTQALEVGYRLFDTAEGYGNEAGVGKAINNSGVDRSELFITTKFNAQWHGEELVRDAFQRSAKEMELEHIDQLLIHWPNPEQDRYVDAWRGLIRMREEGLVSSIGVSNFKPHHLQRLIDETGVAPDVNQIELNPFVSREDVRKFNSKRGIATEAWAPLGKGGELLSDPVVTGIAKRHERSPAQVVLRWHMQLGNIAIPKTANPERLRENFALFDFKLSDQDMEALAGLDRGEAAVSIDSDQFGH